MKPRDRRVICIHEGEAYPSGWIRERDLERPGNTWSPGAPLRALIEIRPMTLRERLDDLAWRRVIRDPLPHWATLNDGGPARVSLAGTWAERPPVPPKPTKLSESIERFQKQMRETERALMRLRYPITVPLKLITPPSI